MTYLSIIMLMSISFSFIFYNTYSQQLDNQLPPKSYYRNIYTTADGVQVDISNDNFDNFFSQRIEEGRSELIARLIWINIGTVIIGGSVSYYLARRTLKPIEESMEAQARFVSDASHELRTPITALQTTNEVALRKKSLTLAEAKDLIAHNIVEATKLKSLSDNLLNLLKQDSRKYELTSVDVQDVVSEAMGSVVNQALAKEISVNDESKPFKVMADAAALAQVLTILLDNAIKYSDDKSSITLTTQKKSSNVCINVVDHGVGIKASDMPHIFDRFYRADNSRTSIAQAGGYGLGLPIAKRIIDSLGGSISVKSVPLKGSTFTIKLSATKSK